MREVRALQAAARLLWVRMTRGTSILVERKRRCAFALARALLHRPAILILDEATTGLDSESEDGICARIRDMVKNEGLTVIAVTHGESWRRMADSIYKLSDGNILAVEAGAPAEVVPISKANPALTA